MEFHVDYWEISDGVSQEEAKEIAAANGFGFELGRISRFENARNAVVIAVADLRDELVNKVLLAEEIQHGHDRQTHEAAKSLRRGLTNVEFHGELFHRLLERYNGGGYSFLNQDNVESIKRVLKEMKP